MNSIKLKRIFALNILLMFFSLSGVCSKLASGEVFLSVGFVFYYTIMIMLLGLYAICWQQLLKSLPLTFAYANKAVTVVWGILWGKLFFEEKVSTGKLIGAAIVMIGIILFALSDSKDVLEESGGKQ